MKDTFQAIEQNHIKKRPRYLTVLSVVLIVWGVGCSLAFGAGTLQVLMTADGGGPASAFFTVVMIQAIWIAITVSGIGIYRGSNWARGLFPVALISLFIITAFSSSFIHLILKVLLDAVLIYALFTSRAKAYFA